MCACVHVCVHACVCVHVCVRVSERKRKEMLYLLLYGIRYMVKEHLDSKRGNLLPPLHGLLFFYYVHIDWIAHTTTFVNPVMVLNISTTRDRSDDPLTYGATSHSE